MLETSNFHLHLTGALTPEDVHKLGGDEKALKPSVEAWQDFDCPDVWAAAKELTSTQRGLANAVSTVLGREALAGTSYVELTINPYGMIRRGMTPDSIAETLVMAQSQSPYPRLRVKYGVNRKDGPSTIPAALATYKLTPRDLRAGIDLNGDECQYPSEDFVYGFLGLARAGILTTIHAGEFPYMTDSLRDALRAEPARIGHAIAAGSSPKLIRQLYNNGIIVESAPTSNISRGVVRTMKEHPIRQFLDNGVAVVLGTDDPGFFRNTMPDELATLRQTGMSDDAIAELNVAANHRRLS